MIRVVLVDDEKWSLYGLMHLIPWEEFGCEIAATATTGQEALAACRDQKPDLLITDICMPDISGLELAQALLAEQKKPAVVFITGHEEIKYAQAAIRLGVFDYLLKPIAAADLTELIQKYRQAYAQRPQLSDGVFFTLFDESNTSSISDSLRRLSLPVGGGRNVRALTLQYAKETAVRGEGAIRCPLGDVAVFRTGRFRLTCFLLSDGPLPEDAFSDADAAIGPEQAQYIGVSQDFPLEGSFHEAYAQSCSAVDTAAFWKSSKYAVYQPGIDLTLPRQTFRQMRDTLKMGKFDRGCIRAWLDALKGMQLDALEGQVNEGLWLARRYLEGTGGTNGDFKLSLDAFEDFTQIEDYFLHLKDGQEEENAKANLTVQKVLAYMEEHYTEKISLTKIAKAFYINPCYLSTLIHDHTGKTYSEIIAGKRMDLVRNLLKNTQLPVTDIAEKAGYNVYSHFLNLFKRETGLPPSVWRTQHAAPSEPADMSKE